MKKKIKYYTLIVIACVFLFGCTAREKTNILGAVVVSPGSEVASAIGNMSTGLRLSKTCATSAKRSPSAFQAPSFAISYVPGLGDADTGDGHYNVTAGGGTGVRPSGSGKLWFLTDFDADKTDKSKVLYMVLPPAPGSMRVYDAPNLQSTSTLLTSVSMGVTKYIPNMWRKLSNGEPTSTGWLTITTSPSTMNNISSTLNTFFNSWKDAGGPLGIYVEYDAVDQFGFQIHQGEVMDMRSGPPSNADPAHVIGTGYMVTPRGRFTTNLDAYIGDLGPISGTMILTSYNGGVGTFTINSDGSIDGVVKDSSGVQLGVVALNADGTGTYTDEKGTHNILN
ncbi:MAG: hypothetical protein A2231_08090 [Candidatus Firestonebacteria bacterium RIFOXYA2_FULL_40_8]|nr:MAG: hypothetical protein A2231_08090 [Candidatus Firestonebacteria bacterium RIFOXYA2_FULL_40_8]